MTTDAARAREIDHIIALARSTNGTKDAARLSIGAIINAAEARGRADGIEAAAQWHEWKAETHARDALWIGPQRQRYEGPRLIGVEMSPANGSALSYDAEMARAAAIRSLVKLEPRK